MILTDVIKGTTQTSLVSINEYELSARIGSRAQIQSDMLDEYIKKYNETAIYRYVYVRVPCTTLGDMCTFENETVYSTALSKVLKDSKEVILLAVSAGIEVDKLINKNSIQNPQASFYIDAIASAGIESYIEYISKKICNGMDVTNRFSPGYADFPLNFQSYLLNRLNAKENIGIMLSKDLLMIPTKSITAVIGIK